VAAAIDTGAGLPVAGHFASATGGNPVRDAWMGASNVSGLVAARMAAAGIARNTGTAALSLGTLLGEFDPAELTGGLGERWDITRGYFKRHASCSFTHPAADACLGLRGGLDPARITGVLVETHALGAGLASPQWHNRLSAMFSTPFAVAAALLHGEVGPRAALDDPALRALARRVRVAEAGDLTARLPDERAARVTVELDDGTARTREVPNPVGDADHRPLEEADVLALLRGWLPGREHLIDRAAALARDLPALDHVGERLRGLAGDETKEER
jgi:2-methylcitrate dehydratase PrpD